MNKLKKWLTIALIPLALIGVVVVSVGCSSKAATTTVSQVTATVEKGNLTVDITAVGNLSYSTSEDLSFDTGGYVSDILVSVGDTVKKGQVVAELNKSDWQQNISDLQSNVTAAQLGLTQDQQNLATAQRNVTTKEQAVTTAENALATAQYNLTVKQRAVTQAQLDIEKAELTVEQDQYAFNTNTGGTWASDNLELAKKQLALTKASLDDANHDVVVAQEAITDAQNAIESAKLDVQDAKTAVTIAEGNVKQAQQNVANAQQALSDAKATSPELTAPYDGLITAVDTTAGTQVYKGGAIVTIVDPTKFETVVPVDETDISKVSVNETATVTLDAISGLVLPATVTYISPTATTSSGVVSYPVTITIDSDKALSQGATKEQIGQLKEGLTTTVDIVYQQATDALLIPTRAISYGANGTTVNVISNGVTTTKTIKTGISDAKNTVVTEGLSEGDVVTYTRTTVQSVTTTTTASRSNNNIMQGLGGQGGPPPGGMQ